MKIVLAAPTIYYGQPELGPSYEYHHFFNSLVACGHDVTLINSFAKGSTQVVLQACETADLLMVVPNSGELEWPLLKKAPCATLAILSDDQWRREYGLSLYPYFDYFMAQAIDSELAYGPKYLPFEWAIWEGLYTQTEQPRDIPVAFLGQLYGDRGEYLFRLMASGVPCLVQGYGFPKELHSSELHTLMQRIQIGLSFSRSSDGSCLQIKTRPFETCAAGALLICEYAPGIEALLTPDVEAVFFTNTQEMIDKVKYYLAHPDEAQAIAAAGRARVLKDHTYAKRWEVLKQVTLKPKSVVHQPKISVLIPAYNAEKTIKRAVRSAFQQAHCDIEVIVCDDGSTDQTAEFARQAGATVISQPNGGVSDALQTATDHANGDYLIVLGADDWYEPNSLYPLAKAMTGSIAFAYGATKYHGIKQDVYVPEQYTPFEFYRHNASLYAFMFKRAVLSHCQWHTFEGGGPEDWDFVLQMIEAGYMGKAVRTVLVLHHVHQKGTLTESATTAEAMHQLAERHPMLKGIAA